MIASVLLDRIDRQIAKLTEDFETFEIDVMGTTVAVDIPEIKSIDDIVAYADYLSELGGDFANLDVSGLKTLSRENGDIEFIYGIIEFMALNSDVFGKVFHWEEGKVFDYGKVGEYILTLDTTVEENKKIVDFYNDYLIGNDIQEKFIAEIAKEMGYTIPADENGERAETFDQTISNGILNWFTGLCEKAGILSADGLAALRLVREAGILPFFAKCDNDHTAADLETVVIPGKAATCTESGVEDAYACADCGYVVSGGGTIDALGHDYKTDIVEATCTETGTKTTTCSRCDYNVTETLSKKAHSYGAWTVATAAGCEADGVEIRKCDCGATESRDIPATGHKDADGNYVCDSCSAELPQPEKSFFEKIIDFFNSIIEWFKNLFGIA